MDSLFIIRTETEQNGTHLSAEDPRSTTWPEDANLLDMAFRSGTFYSTGHPGKQSLIGKFLIDCTEKGCSGKQKSRHDAGFSKGSDSNQKITSFLFPVS